MSEAGLSLITREEIDGLLKVDWEFVRVSEQIRDTALAYLQTEPAIEDILDGKNRAQAIGSFIARKVQAREAKLEAQNNIAEVRIRYERELGKLIQKMQADGELARPSDGPAFRSPTDEVVDKPITLAAVGITYNQSSRWQAMAQLPIEKFEEQIAEAKENGWELTSAAIARHGANHVGKNNPEGGAASNNKLIVEMKLSVADLGLDLRTAAQNAGKSDDEIVRVVITEVVS